MPTRRTTDTASQPARPAALTRLLLDREVVRVHVRLVAVAVLVDVAPQDDSLALPVVQRVAPLHPGAPVGGLLEEGREGRARRVAQLARLPVVPDRVGGELPHPEGERGARGGDGELLLYRA